MSKKENIKSINILRVGEFLLTQYSKKSILISKDDGEAIEVGLKTLKKFWKENY